MTSPAILMQCSLRRNNLGDEEALLVGEFLQNNSTLQALSSVLPSAHFLVPPQTHHTPTRTHTHTNKHRHTRAYPHPTTHASCPHTNTWSVHLPYARLVGLSPMIALGPGFCASEWVGRRGCVGLWVMMVGCGWLSVDDGGCGMCVSGTDWPPA